MSEQQSRRFADQEVPDMTEKDSSVVRNRLEDYLESQAATVALALLPAPSSLNFHSPTSSERIRCALADAEIPLYSAMVHEVSSGDMVKEQVLQPSKKEFNKLDQENAQQTVGSDDSSVISPFYEVSPNNRENLLHQQGLQANDPSSQKMAEVAAKYFSKEIQAPPACETVDPFARRARYTRLERDDRGKPIPRVLLEPSAKTRNARKRKKNGAAITIAELPDNRTKFLCSKQTLTGVGLLESVINFV